MSAHSQPNGAARRGDLHEREHQGRRAAGRPLATLAFTVTGYALLVLLLTALDG